MFAELSAVCAFQVDSKEDDKSFVIGKMDLSQYKLRLTKAILTQYKNSNPTLFVVVNSLKKTL